jgi:hypothetical protein
MRLLSPRWLVLLSVVVIAWGGFHLLGAHTVAVTPAVWPVAQPSPSPRPASALPAASPAPTVAAASDDAIPVLPAAMGQLNGSTRDTAIGLYAVIQQLEDALRIRLEDLVKQLEPGR